MRTTKCLILLDLRDFDTSLQEVGSKHHGVREELPIVLDRLNSLHVLLRFSFRLKVWISWALFDSVTDLLATETSYIPELFGLILLVLLLPGVILIILLALVLADLAPLGLLGCLAAAPPHLARVLARVRATRPVIILLFQVLLAALFAYLLVVLDPEPLVLELLYPLLELDALELRTPGSLGDLLEVAPQLVDLLVLQSQL